MKAKLLFGDNVFSATWQDKTFSDEMAALEFIRKHRDKIVGINGIVGYVKTMNHFEIMRLLKEGISNASN